MWRFSARPFRIRCGITVSPEASTCSLFYPIQPLTSMVLGVLLLNEHMTVGFIVGAVLIVFGVLYSTLGKEKTR